MMRYIYAWSILSGVADIDRLRVLLFTVAENGSWNRTEEAGYRIIRLVFWGDSAREKMFLKGC